MAKKPSRIRRTFTPQLKKDAVALVLDGRTVNEVAHDLGIARSLLQRWKTQLAREPDVPAAFPGASRLAQLPAMPGESLAAMPPTTRIASITRILSSSR
jgi:transposase-like protein